MTEIRRYTFKLYPNKAQIAALERQAALLAWLWNSALEQREWQWRQEVERKGHWRRIARAKEDKPKGLTFYDQGAQLKELRASDPEYAALSSASLACCLKALDRAFQAFWRRLKEGCDPGSAGYPRYKSSKRHRTIWHGARRVNQKPLTGCGWSMERSGKHWKFYFKGVPGKIKARGRFPCAPEDYRTMEIIERDGCWIASVVTKQEARLSAGATALRIEFDLLDEFARVKNDANGECLPALTPVFSAGEGGISSSFQGGCDASAAYGLENGADGRPYVYCQSGSAAAYGLENGADGRSVARTTEAAQAADGLENGAGSDAIQSQRDKRFRKFSCRWRKETRRIARRKAHEARQRKETLHEWTTRIVRAASEITVIAPPIREHTRSGRGDKYEWGGAVETVAALNRHTLSQAPAMAIQMLEYKAAEAGIPFRKIAHEETKLVIGRDLSETVKTARKARRKLKEAA